MRKRSPIYFLSFTENTEDLNGNDYQVKGAGLSSTMEKNLIIQTGEIAAGVCCLPGM
jgi:hypothetical protein